MKLRGRFLPLNSAIARPLVPLFIGLRFSANAVTILSLCAGLLAGLAFTESTAPMMLMGAVGFFLSNVLDECDGTVARQTNNCSQFGALLDTVTDCIVHAALFLGLGIGLHHRFPDGPWFFLGAVATGGSILSCALDIGGITPWQPPRPTDEASLAWVTEWFRIDFSLLVILSALFRQMGWILWAGALGVFFFWIPSTFLIAVRSRRSS